MAKQTKQKNLSLSTVKKVSKQLDTTETYTIESEHYKGEQITFQPIFDDITIENLFIEYQQLILEADKKEFEISQDMQITLLNFLIIKHFTHFKKDIPSVLINNTKDGILEWIKHFTKSGLFKEMLEEMFLPQECAKIFKRLTDVVATSMIQTDLEAETKQKYESLKVKNSFIFDQIRNIKVDNEDEVNETS